MFEPNMDEYLDEEIDSVQQAFDVINREWEHKVGWVIILITCFY